MPSMDWIGAERIAIGSLPTATFLRGLSGEGVTHIVNCRARAQTLMWRDLARERALFGRDRVVHAAMWDSGLPQPAARWSAAALFAAGALAEDPGHGVLIHCKGGRRRSVLVAYAVLRLRGHGPEDAASLILRHRREAVLVPAYQTSVEDWLVTRRSPPSRS